MMYQGEVTSRSCSYCEQTYYESDTGYGEYGCMLGDNNPKDNPCREDGCPLICKWSVEE